MLLRLPPHLSLPPPPYHVAYGRREVIVGGHRSIAPSCEDHDHLQPIVAKDEAATTEGSEEYESKIAREEGDGGVEGRGEIVEGEKKGELRSEGGDGVQGEGVILVP